VCGHLFLNRLTSCGTLSNWPKGEEEDKDCGIQPPRGVEKKGIFVAGTPQRGEITSIFQIPPPPPRCGKNNLNVLFHNFSVAGKSTAEDPFWINDLLAG
jgi:hypothetical protein